MKRDFQQIVDLIETNIRQRGIGNPNPVKLGRCIKELERIYTIQNGGDRKSEPKLSELKDENDIHTQKQLADMIGISVDTLNNYKKLTELVPELQDWVETGNVIVICVVYHIPIISCTYVYLACKSDQMCWCRDFRVRGFRGGFGAQNALCVMYGSWIDARMLHKELKVGKKFTDWIKGRIDKYEFIELV